MCTASIFTLAIVNIPLTISALFLTGRILRLLLKNLTEQMLNNINIRIITVLLVSVKQKKHNTAIYLPVLNHRQDFQFLFPIKGSVQKQEAVPVHFHKSLYPLNESRFLKILKEVLRVDQQKSST